MQLPRGKVIFTASLDGAFVTKAMTPHVPEQPEELAQAALDCYNAGAAIVHIHARDKSGKPAGGKEIFQEIISAIRAKCSDVIIQFSTAGGSNLTMEERLSCLEALPEMCSLNMGTLLRTAEGPAKGTPFLNTPWDVETWAARITELGIKPEMELYSQAMYREVNSLIKKNILKPPYYVNFVLGMRYQGAIDATPENLASMYSFLPENAYFNVTATSAQQLPITTMGMIMGGACRVGLEDNIYYSRGVLAESNAQLVERSVRIARDLNMTPCSAAETREILGVAKR